MIRKSLCLLILMVLISCETQKKETTSDIPTNGPIQLHPENPHYFLFKGKAHVLITSAEHYGALINLEFDYKKYLETLAAEGMNYTRIFTGTYYEIQGESFGIQQNTLAPEKDKRITPWAIVSSDSPGEFKYDLATWNEDYFKRLKDLMSEAAKHNIIVEVTLFSSIYRDEHWDIIPQNPKNNINITDRISRLEAHTLDNQSLLDYQLAFVKKMAVELNEFDNFFFEIQNEPWADLGVAVYNIVNKEELDSINWTLKADLANEASLRWQERVAAEIRTTENDLPKKHLIAQNYTNFKAPIPEVDDTIDILNFHYAWPEAVSWNYHYNKLIGFDESGFAGSEDKVYRRQAWRFMLSGGGLYNNLDYSFYEGFEDGTGIYEAPGGGSKALRKQLKTLSDFLHGFELQTLRPDSERIENSKGLIPYMLSDGKDVYAIYLRTVGTENVNLKLRTGEGSFKIQTLNPVTGVYGEPLSLMAEEGLLDIVTSTDEGEIAISVIRENE
ncbi:hypothetical protein [Poritiphilus flavus]|uniref:Cellulase (Glycosyl hydrolase family 5) n=1 Tax=Poritiphilus flavus TaxID=2697053 RepID=A0A6L9E839_9FLAO|nr:hypothetical protein [Poritiphilus flavus]NAS10619.1 hypothetical protein [Poritiphilus flavus]